ncbi:MAG: ATP-binding cassette domain-containing protein [bacterium]|nr:ATP-binding cassette domain-containing protein [bacterium]
MIELISVDKSFADKKIVKGLNLRVNKGERIAVIGQSGIGKSTLLRLILGLHMPDYGRVLIEGNDISKMSFKDIQEIRMKFGIVFQSAALFDSMTVEENVAFPLLENTDLSLSQVKNRVTETLDMVGMSGAELFMPSDLSGGQKKRIGFARAIIARPEIVLYDEPTTGQDPVLSTNIEDLIIKLNDKLKTTSIVVTHQISTIMRAADKIYLMYEGMLLEPETPETIYDSSNDMVRNFIRGGL